MAEDSYSIVACGLISMLFCFGKGRKWCVSMDNNMSVLSWLELTFSFWLLLWCYKLDFGFTFTKIAAPLVWILHLATLQTEIILLQLLLHYCWKNTCAVTNSWIPFKRIMSYPFHLPRHKLADIWVKTVAKSCLYTEYSVQDTEEPLLLQWEFELTLSTNHCQLPHQVKYGFKLCLCYPSSI